MIGFSGGSQKHENLSDFGDYVLGTNNNGILGTLNSEGFEDIASIDNRLHSGPDLYFGDLGGGGESRNL